ncbi:MAG TPA: putative O-glycosylation ligase, exosortase A system-associated [Burkholderiaceae bacterium]|nr:putative O-glycosylation ligase, exosortase A system-associated [Burkholderiaceae bacterium]
MRDLVILASIIGLVPFILRHAWIGVLAWTWIGLMNPHLYSWRSASFPVAMVIGGSTLLSLLYSKDKRGVAMSGPIVLMGVLLLFFTIKTPFAWNQPEAWWQWDKVFKIYLMTFVTTMLIYGEKRIHALVLTIIVSLGFYGVKGGLFTLATGGSYRVEAPEGSFIGGNTQLGLALVMLLPLYLAFSQVTRYKWVRLGCWGAFWLSMVAIVFTYSRGALIGLASVSIPLWLMTKRRVLALIVAIPAIAAGFSFAPDKLINRAGTIGTYEQDLSAMQRIQAWSVARNIAIENPVLGAGFNLDYMPYSTWITYSDPEFYGPGFHLVRAAHSVYFQMLGEHGFMGLGLYAIMVLCTYITLNRTRVLARRDPQLFWAGRYAAALMASILGFLTAGAFLSLAYFDLLYVYVALAAILRREVAERVERKVTPSDAHAKALPARSARPSNVLTK